MSKKKTASIPSLQFGKLNRPSVSRQHWHDTQIFFFVFFKFVCVCFFFFVFFKCLDKHKWASLGVRQHVRYLTTTRSIPAASYGCFMATDWTKERIILLMGKRNAGGIYLPDTLSLGQKGTGHKRLDGNTDLWPNRPCFSPVVAPAIS